MYKVIVDEVEIFSTDELSEYVDYCVERHLIYELVNDIISGSHEMKLFTQ